MKVAAAVVSHNTRDDLVRCLESLRRHGGVPVEIVVVDNASGDGSVEAVRHDYPEVRLIENSLNLGFGRANNQALRATAAPFVLLLNSDAEVAPGSLPALVDLLEARPEIGAVGPRTLNADGTVQVSTGEDLTPLAEWRQSRLVRAVGARDPEALREAERRHSEEREVAWVSASCLLARREALLAVGGFDEDFFLYVEDADLCRRVRRAGWKVLFTPRAQVLHRQGRSMARAGFRPRLEYHRSHLLYYRKHNGPLLTALLRGYFLALALVRQGPEGRALGRLGLLGR